MLLEAKAAVSPRDVEALVHRLRGLQPQSGPTGAPDVVPALTASWLSPRTRGLLEAAGVCYLDLTGNVFLRMDQPAVLVRTSGAEKDPAPPARGEVTLRGAAAGRVVRLLTDVRPPYTATEIASRAGVSLPYTSRLLTMLDREALIRRGPRGRVEHVEWADLLRRRAESYQVFSTNTAHSFIAPQGARDMVQRLGGATEEFYRAVTGSFAIGAEQDRVAAPSQLVVYVDDVDATASELGLLVADEGADVVLLDHFDFAVVDRLEDRDGYRVVRSTQIVLDCLTGNGRLPAQGEALLGWMSRNGDQWRYPDIAHLGTRAEVFP